MSEDNRTALIGGLWTLAALLIGALIVATSADLNVGHIFLCLVIFTVTTLGTVYLLRMPDPALVQEKAKHRSIDSIVSGLTVAELRELKNRLAFLDEANAYEDTLLVDDGELMMRQ